MPSSSESPLHNRNSQIKEQAKTLDVKKNEIGDLHDDEGIDEDHSLTNKNDSTIARKDSKIKVEKKRWYWFITYLLLQQSLKDAIARVEEIIKFHQAQMETLAELIREARSNLTELDEQKQALIRELNRFRETGRFDLNENGRFKNARAEEATAAWEEKTSSQIDLRNPSSYLDVMETVNGIEVHEAEIEAGIEKGEQDYQYHKTKRDEAIEIKNDLESGESERCRNALERLENLENDQRLGTIENSLTSEAEIDNNQKNQILSQMELTDEDLSYDGFSFNFPPLLPDFNRSVIDSDKGPTNKESKKPELKTFLPGPSMR